jgi:hypothetical protein
MRSLLSLICLGLIVAAVPFVSAQEQSPWWMRSGVSDPSRLDVGRPVWADPGARAKPHPWWMRSGVSDPYGATASHPGWVSYHAHRPPAQPTPHVRSRWYGRQYYEAGPSCVITPQLSYYCW